MEGVEEVKTLETSPMNQEEDNSSTASIEDVEDDESYTSR